jgi:F-type H+-transporting ATPase subunit b
MLDFSVTFFITIINIAFLYFILRKILFKPVTKFMADRAKRIQDSIEQSENDKTHAKALLAKYDAQLNTAHTEADSIIRKAREMAQVEAEKIITESRISAEKELEKMRRQLEMEHHAAIENFRLEAAALVVAVTGRLLEREIKTEDNRQYVEMLLDEMSRSSEIMPEAGKD